jgi:beta propeller repeat protein
LTIAAALLLLCSIAATHTGAAAWPNFPVLPGDDDQECPGVDGTIVVWQEFVSRYGDYDIYVVDVNDLANRSVTILGDANDQMYPAIYDRRVVWQDHIVWSEGDDWDIRMADVRDFGAPEVFAVSQIAYNDELRPAIHGNVVVWEDTVGVDYDIYGADVTDPWDPLEFAVAAFEYDQRRPSIYRNTVVWEDNVFGDWDLIAADIWLRDQPKEFPVVLLEYDQQASAISDDVVVWEDDFAGTWDIYGAVVLGPNDVTEFDVATHPSSQRHPDIDGHLIVWQDDRAGNWDIYGYNLVTGEVFRITDDTRDQVNPAISGNLVVWQDNRDGLWQVYGAILDGPEIVGPQAYATSGQGGDGPDFDDLARIASVWLGGYLDLATADDLPARAEEPLWVSAMGTEGRTL